VSSPRRILNLFTILAGTEACSESLPIACDAPAFDSAVLSPGDAAEIAMRKDFPKD
jgi:hypothetical protein